MSARFLRSALVRSGLEGSGPSLPLGAVNQHRFTAPTERTPSSGSANIDPGHTSGFCKDSKDEVEAR